MGAAMFKHFKRLPPLATSESAAKTWRKAYLAAGSLAALAAAPLAELPAQNVVPRSVLDVRERIPDELDRPRYHERWTHRGWHVRSDVFEVVANTRVEDAHFALQQAERAWADTSRIADHWTKAHRQADFALGKVQIFVDGERPKDRDLPRTTLDVVGMQTQIHLYTSPDQPPLAEQLPRLRQATALALMHTAEMDRELPPWVYNGLATYVAEQGMPPQSKYPQQEPAGVQLGGQQWRWKRATEDTLDVPPPDDLAAARVKFLLEGNDAAHTFEFFQAVKGSIATEIGRAWLEKRNSFRRGEAQPNTIRGKVDDLAAATEAEFNAWQRDPLIGQPIFLPPADAVPKQVELQRQLVFVLKLLRRFPEETVAKTRMKVHEFGAQPEPNATAAATKSAQPVDLEKLWTRLTGPAAEPWATLDPDGKLLLSMERERLGQLLRLEGRDFKAERQGDRTSVAVQLDQHTSLRGWLEDNRENPRRPLARFETIDLRQKAAVQPQPAQQARGK